MAGTTILLSPRTSFACPEVLILKNGSESSKPDWFEETYSRIRNGVHGHREKVNNANMQEALQGITFAFVAVDCDEDRMLICDSLAAAKIPFSAAGLSLALQGKQVTVGMRIVTAILILHLGET